MKSVQQKSNGTPKRICLLMALLFSLVFYNCEKEELVQQESEELTSVAHKWHSKKKKITICHSGRNGHCRIIKVSKRAWRAHKRHGDVRLDDQDGDGYVPDNACGYGQMGDCDDNDPNATPEIPGSCGGEIDSDGDGVPDEEDVCPDDLGLPELNGCPDADGDGIADNDDDCPTEAGPAVNDGCPFPDSDNDGVIDRDDDCPDDPGLPELNGCPETYLSEYEVLRLLYESNPGNGLGWDLSNSDMDDWNGVFLDDTGQVIGLRLLFGLGITQIIPEIRYLKSLQELLCACEGVQNIPKEIGEIEGLITLGITGSEISDIPEEIAMLRNLKILAVFDNKNFDEVPIWIGGMASLQALNLSGNSLTDIPTTLANLSGLEILSLEENPVTSIPQAVCDLADDDTEVVLDSDDICE